MKLSALSLGLLQALIGCQTPTPVDFCTTADHENGILLVGSRLSVEGTAYVYDDGHLRKLFVRAHCLKSWEGQQLTIERYILIDGDAEVRSGDQIKVRGNLNSTSSPIYDGPAYHFFLDDVDIEFAH